MAKRSFFLALVLVVAATAIAFAASGGGSKDVVICAQKSDGALSLADKGKCGKGEKKLTIAKQGPQGPQGSAGAPGQNGTTASIQPEAVHLVSPVDSEVPAAPDCATHPGIFCSEDEYRWRSVGESFEAVGFQKDAAGYVHLSGTAIAFAGTNTPIAKIFYLPVAYRPAAERRFVALNCLGSPKSVLVGADGVVEAPDDECISLDGIDFHP